MCLGNEFKRAGSKRRNENAKLTPGLVLNDHRGDLV